MMEEMQTTGQPPAMMQWMMMKGKGKGFSSFGKGKGKGKGGKGRMPGSKTDPNLDMKGKPGPNGEDPSEGRWSFESKGANAPKKWKWKKERTEEERAAKKAKKEYEELMAGL